jgi:hypothetical protein
MRSKIFILICILFVSSSLIEAQTVLSIRLGRLTGQDATVMDIYPNQNFKTDLDIAGIAWSISGLPYKCRSFFKYDLSGIPVSTQIDSARLTLYGNPSPQHSPGHSNFSGSDACFLSEVSSNWQDSSLTWNNQPSVSTSNRILLPQSTSSMQDYPNIDVTNLVRFWISNPSTNFGLSIMLQTEVRYRSLDFASSYCTDSTKRPKLDIYLTLVGVKRISNEIPGQFNLYQNFPNPFNPATNIKYDLPKITNVKLVVYDVMGKEVATLVNEKQEAGTYEVTWDASNISSGLYFYKLITGDYSDAKRIILLK